MLDSLLSGLGYLADSLDKPGRAVRGVLAGNGREALAALPFSDSAGLTDPGQRTSGRDLLTALGASPGEGTLGDLAGFGAELATDPLTYAGAGLGRLLARPAAAAAVARGPRYATTADDLAGLLGRAGSENGMMTMSILQNKAPEALARAATEVDPAASFLGAGMEGMAFRNPNGSVVRIGEVPGAAPGRPTAEGVLGATRGVDVPFADYEARAVRAETVPYAQDVGNSALMRRDPQTMLTPLDQLDATLGKSGIKYVDRQPVNHGTYGGQPVVIDPGALDLSGYAGGYQPVATAADPSRVMSALLDLLGSDAAVRSGVVDFRRPLTGLGAGAGALTGAFARPLGNH